jgi:hypothetical protein
MPLTARVTGRGAFAIFCARIPAALSALSLCVACGSAAVSPDGGQPSGGGPIPRVRIVTGASATDTISAILRDPLTVEVTDASGTAVVGRAVHFEVSIARPGGPGTQEYYTVGLTSAGGVGFAFDADVPTDAKGRATAYIRLGDLAGPAVVKISVPTLGDGFANQANYTVLPGAPDHVVLIPADTAVYVGAGYRLSGYVNDRGQNKLASAPLSFSVASGGATVGPDGTVTATAVGRVRIAVQSAGVSGTAWMSVPPRAVVATQQHDSLSEGPIGVFLMELDGSARVSLAKPIDNARVSGQGFDWSPDGTNLVIARGDSIDLVSPGSAERRLVKMNGPVLLGARYSRDGAWIYFSMPNTGLSRMRSDGTGVVETLGNLIGIGWRPSPSPDGLYVAYGSDNTPCGVQDCIRVLDIASGQPRTYAGGKDWLVRGRNSAWSPVDDLIAYAWDFDVNNNEVGLIRADGTGQRVLAKDMYGVNWMDFSPDGKWLLVGARFKPVTLFNVQTGERLPLATLAHYGATAWRR